MIDRILIVDDEDVLRHNLCEFLEDAGFRVDGAADGIEALERVEQHDYEIVVTDIRMPRLDGIGLLKRLVAERPETSVLITTAYASVETAVDALRLGAFDYMLKPIIFEDLLQKVKILGEYRALKGEVGRLRRSLHEHQGFEGIVGDSAVIREMFDLIDTVAATRSTVLITGESGTGKELVARAVHARSDLKDREFLAVNLSAIPRDLVEAHLFGHEKGAFTGAGQRRAGILRTVAGGTVFLDEIGDLEPRAQASLLRTLDNGEILPLGASRPVRAEFRLITATNQPLEEMVESNRFRRDLFYRLNVFRVEVPPLRERRDDIPALTRHFLQLHARQVRMPVTGVSNKAMKLLTSYSWPGNVRELSNVIERSVLLSRGDLIEATILPREVVAAPEPVSPSLRVALERFERQHIEATLSEVDGNKEAAARLLEVHLATLYRRLEKLGIK